MTVVFDKKELAQYPFLKEAQNIVREMGISLDTLIRSDDGEGAEIKDKAVERINAALISKYPTADPSLDSPDTEILSYGMARIIVSCLGERAIIDRLTRYEAGRAHYFLLSETPEKKQYVASSLGIDPNAKKMNVVKYVELVSGLHEDRWRLVNREVEQGMVVLEDREIDDLLRERIRSILLSQLPLDIPGTICLRLKEQIDGVSIAYQQKILEDFGDIEEACFPPCIQALIGAITAGTNIPHTGRFAITAFLHTIGMNPTQIVEVFTRAPDFDISRTMYQVEHISGAGGTEYTPPSCATMRTNGLCVNQDKECKNVHHPLSYYRVQKKRDHREKKAAS